MFSQWQSCALSHMHIHTHTHTHKITFLLVHSLVHIHSHTRSLIDTLTHTRASRETMSVTTIGSSVGGRPLSNDAVFRIEVSLSSRRSSAIVMRTTARLYTLDQGAQTAQGSKGEMPFIYRLEIHLEYYTYSCRGWSCTFIYVTYTIMYT